MLPFRWVGAVRQSDTHVPRGRSVELSNNKANNFTELLNRLINQIYMPHREIKGSFYWIHQYDNEKSIIFYSFID